MASGFPAARPDRAPEAVWPEALATAGAIAAQDDPLLAAGGGADALIEVLHRLQERQGYLSRAALRQVAGRLQLPLSHVLGVASFYHLFRLHPASRNRCGICLGSACFVRGAALLAQRLAERLQVEIDAPADHCGWSLMRLGCLGACGQAPVLVVDGQLLTRLPLDPAAADQLEERLRQAGLPAQPGDEPLCQPGDPPVRAGEARL